MHALLLSLAMTVTPDPHAAGSYPLDGVSRDVAPRGPARCPAVPLVVYKGSRVRYDHPARVHPAFAERLRMFEEVLVDVAREHFGRAPVTMQHAGTYSCRRIGGYPTLISEHGIGNGIDVVAFSFPGLPRKKTAPSDLPASLRRPFRVSLADFQAEPNTPRARFLDALARRLIGRHDIFRVLLGPAYPGHKGHFHFDVAPYRVVSIWTSDDDGPAAP
jgi:extensin-like protein